MKKFEDMMRSAVPEAMASLMPYRQRVRAHSIAYYMMLILPLNFNNVTCDIVSHAEGSFFWFQYVHSPIFLFYMD